MGLALRRELGFPPWGAAASAAAAQAPAAQRSDVADRGRRPNANGAEAGVNRHDRALKAQRSCRASLLGPTVATVGNDEVGVVAR